MSGDAGDKSLPEKLRNARKSPAVLKYQLATFRSSQPDVVIFAFEGDDDKIIYGQWVLRIRGGLRYEPFVCKGKSSVLNLADVVARDQSGDGKNVYCFVDRDFDELQGRPVRPYVFMTTTHSAENLLVTSEVLENVLTTLFHCDGRPDVRGPICQQFNGAYDQFLTLAKAFNFRVFASARLGIDIVKGVPDKLQSYFKTELQGVIDQGLCAVSVLAFSREPTDDELASLRAEFAALSARDRYRGTWALAFFSAWLLLLAEEYRNPAKGLFKNLDKTSKPRVAECVLSTYAARAHFPEGLDTFIAAIPAS